MKRTWMLIHGATRSRAHWCRYSEEARVWLLACGGGYSDPRMRLAADGVPRCKRCLRAEAKAKGGTR